MILTVRDCYTTCPQFISHHPPTHLLSRMGSIPLEGDILISSSEQKQKKSDLAVKPYIEPDF